MKICLFRLTKTVTRGMIWLLNRCLSHLAGALVITLAYTIFRLKAKGRRCLPKKGPYLLIANHVGDLDPWLLYAAALITPGRIAFAAAEERFCASKFLRYLFVEILHVVPLDRRQPTAGLKRCLKALKTGKILIIFPEGTRSETGKLLPFEEGAAALALAIGCPIAPAYIFGSLAAMPKGAKFPKPRSITIVFGSPIHPPVEEPSDRRKAIEELTCLARCRVVALSDCDNSF
jgi:1-acyl-sn-glycerol-3-phosphate acyltransferase